MSFQVNQVAVSGNMTAAPDQRSLPSGMSVTSFSIAHNARRKVNEEWVDQVSFFEITMFGAQGEWLAKNATKGDPLTVSGTLEQQRWEKDGEKRSKVSILARDVVLGQRVGDRKSQEPSSYQQPAATQSYGGQGGSPYDEDLAF